jgi:hypothetical protein
MSTPISAQADSQVNTSTTGDQFVPVVAHLNSGYVIAWQSFVPNYAGGESGSDIYIQRYSDSGQPLGGEVRVNAVTAGLQHEPSVAATADGGFVVAWSSGESGAGMDVFVQRFDAQGNALGGPVQANTYQPLDQDRASVTGLSNGGFAVTWWSDSHKGSPAGIYSRVYGADGAAIGGENVVTTSTAGPQAAPVAAALANGAYVLAWDGANGIHAQAFDAQGHAISGDLRVDSGAGGATARPAIATLADGGVAVVWQSVAPGGDGLDIHLQRFAANGSPVGDDTLVNHNNIAGLQTSPAIAALPDGGYVVSWTTNDGSLGATDDVIAQRFDAGGNATANEQMLNTATTGNQSAPALAATPDDGFLAVWQSQGQDGSGWAVEATFEPSGAAALRSVVKATEGSDKLIGTWEDNACVALGGDDVYFSQGGSDWFDGGTGLDTFIFPESYKQVSAYEFDQTGQLTIHTHDAHNPVATPIILNTERIQFSDAVFALDTAAGGHVWEAAAIIRAASGASGTMTSLSQATAQVDASASMGVAAQKYIDANLHGITNTALVSQVYFNVTGQHPSDAVVAQFANQIGVGKTFATQGDALAHAAGLDMNTSHLLLGQVVQLDPTYFPHTL